MVSKKQRLYIVFDSAKLGGDIGWVNDNQISDKIRQIIINLDLNELSTPCYSWRNNYFKIK